MWALVRSRAILSWSYFLSALKLVLYNNNNKKQLHIVLLYYNRHYNIGIANRSAIRWALYA